MEYGGYVVMNNTKWLTEEGLKTLQNGYFQEGEDQDKMFERIVNKLVTYLPEDKFNRDEVKTIWYNYLWNNWLCPATPVAANVGTNKGLPISCYLVRVADNTYSIFNKITECAMLTKYGGGLGVSFDKVRGRGEIISKGGFTEGIIPFLKTYEMAIHATAQAGVRRGAMAAYLPVRHKDIEEFVEIRKPKGDLDRRCLTKAFHHGISIDDIFMESMLEGNAFNKELWSKILKTRMETGQSYIMFYDNARRQRPQCFIDNNLKINQSNLCSEIFLPTDEEHTAVCCLSSMNMAKYDEWKNDAQFIEMCLLFLDCVMEDFIQQAKYIQGFECAVRFAKKTRALGLGILGWGTYLQQKHIPFISLQSKAIITKLSNKLKIEGENYNRVYGNLLGNSEWTGKNRNSTLYAVAPTTSNSLISGGISQGIEPLISNYYVQSSAKGDFIRKNPLLEKLIKHNYKEHNTIDVWNSIRDNKGSVQHLEWMSNDNKEVFKTAYEINQLELVKNIGILQKGIDQGISTNLFFPSDVDPKWLNQVHIEAWKQGLKSLYYLRTESIAAKSMKTDTFSDCVFCEG